MAAMAAASAEHVAFAGDHDGLHLGIADQLGELLCRSSPSKAPSRLGRWDEDGGGWFDAWAPRRDLRKGRGTGEGGYNWV